MGLRALDATALECVLRAAMERTRTAFPGKQHPIRRLAGTRNGPLAAVECRLADAGPFAGAIGRRHSPVAGERSRNRRFGRDWRISLNASRGVGIHVPDRGGKPLRSEE